MASVMTDHVGIGDLDADVGDVPQLASQRGDHVLGSVHGNGDDVDAALGVGQTHTADDICADIMEHGVERGNGIGLLNDDG